MELKRVGVLNVAKIAGLFGVIYGLFAGIFFSIIYKIGSTPGMTEEMNFFSQLGYASIIIFPVVYGIIYFLGAALAVLIYNLLAKWIGGIEVEFKEEKIKKK